MKLNSPLLPLLIAALLTLQILFPSKVWEALLVAFCGAWLAAWLWARSIHRGLHLERSMRFGWAQVGDALEEQFQLSNKGLLPVPWLEIIDHSNLPGYRASLATCLSAHETDSWRTRGTCSRRGVFTLGGATLRSGDPLGIYSVEIEHGASTTLVVMPAVVPLPAIEVAAGGWLGEGRPHPQAAEKVYSASAVRPYLPGDSLHLIHWRTTARMAEPFVRETEGAPEGVWWIVLDAEAGAQAGDEHDSTLEAGVIVAASLADRGLRARKEVGLLAQGSESVWLRPRAGEGIRLEVLRALATINPGCMPLAQLLERAAPSLGRNASLIVITPSLGTDWLKAVSQLAWKGISPTVILLDPASFGGACSAAALAGMLAERGIRRHVITRELLNHPQARPEARGQWEWRILPTGKAIPTRMPGDMSWKRLG